MENTLEMFKVARNHLSGSSKDWADRIVLNKAVEILEEAVADKLPASEVVERFRSNRMFASGANRYAETQAWDIYTDFFQAASSSELTVA